METSPTTKELTTALCQFQAAQLKATKASKNPAFKSTYAGLNEVLDAVLPTLTESGLCFVQFPDGEALTTRLLHVSGEWMQASYTLKPASATPQASGSALTYARRYALLAILGLGTEDDDGHAASQAPKAAQQPAPVAADKAGTDTQRNDLRKLLDELDTSGKDAKRDARRAMLHSYSCQQLDQLISMYRKQVAALHETGEVPNG